jgi:hypothetical protein
MRGDTMQHKSQTRTCNHFDEQDRPLKALTDGVDDNS